MYYKQLDRMPKTNTNELMTSKRLIKTSLKNINTTDDRTLMD
jgi:hypothetical protein